MVKVMTGWHLGIRLINCPQDTWSPMAPPPLTSSEASQPPTVLSADKFCSKARFADIGTAF